MTTINQFKNLLPDGYTLLYVTKSGSKLYGTDTPASDTDYKGVYVASKESLFTKTDLDEVTSNTASHKQKNTAEDVDCTLDSLHKFFRLLKKGETGALDLLFSMFREDTIVYADKDFLEFMKENYKSFLSSNTKAFMGYCFQQATKYGLKGKRYDSLMKLFNDTLSLEKVSNTKTVSDWLGDLDFTTFDESHVKVTNREGFDYLYVLGKEFNMKMPMRDAEPVLKKMSKMYGERTKATSEFTTDFKSLSHAVRVVDEVKELLSEEFVTFPLKNAQYVKEVKMGLHPVEDVVNKLENDMSVVENLLFSTKLPLQVNEELVMSLLLEVINTRS